MIGSLQINKMPGQNSRPTTPHSTLNECNSQPRQLSRLSAHPGMNEECVNLAEGFSEYIKRAFHRPIGNSVIHINVQLKKLQ